ncbi:MAG: lipid-transfer protein [Pseudomonadales bacterium]|nr:lipid-transfer protein [Pseudomonadales bacterium]
MSRKAHIVGVGETPYAKWGRIAEVMQGDVTEHALAHFAIMKAVEDAGLSIDDVDGLASFAEDRNEAIFIAAELGIPELRFGNMVWMPGGGGGCAAVSNAAMAVETGQAEVVVVYRALCQGEFMRFGHAAELMANDGGGAAEPPPVSFQQANTLMLAAMGQVMPFGMLTGAAAFALPFRRHMHKYGTSSEHLGKIAVTFREHANRNPRAVLKDKPLSLEQHQGSRMIADPFRLFDCCMENDGACAVVVTTEERARSLKKRPVEIVASVQGAPKGYSFGSFTNANIDDAIYATGGTEQMANRLWQKAGMRPEDVDVAQIYDHFTGSVLMQLEDFGFCKRGEGGDFIDSGALSWKGGSLPTNTSGGSLSEAYMHGLNHVLEGARSLWGESCCPVENANVCLVTSAAGVPSSALLLKGH